MRLFLVDGVLFVHCSIWVVGQFWQFKIEFGKGVQLSLTYVLILQSGLARLEVENLF